jgi:hypothetical protein
MASREFFVKKCTWSAEHEEPRLISYGGGVLYQLGQN